jgi:hypothetical protein
MTLFAQKICLKIKRLRRGYGFTFGAVLATMVDAGKFEITPQDFSKIYDFFG